MVETGRVIRPVGIAEEECAIGEVEALQRDPACICHVCGGLDYDGDVGGAGDVETKAGWPDAAGLHQGVPKDGWASGKRRTPAGGAGEVIDGRAGRIEFKVWDS